MIFDRVDNNILNKINNLFGYGSNYKLSYLFSLECPNEEWSELGYMLEIVDIIDLTGDVLKEIVVQFQPLDISGNGAYYEMGIFSYSYEKHKYYLLGTYPLYNDDRIPKRKSNERNYYNKNEVFNLEGGLRKFYVEYFAHDGFDRFLIRTEMIFDLENEKYYDLHKYIISVFIPVYNSDTDELDWEVVFSGETDDYISDCSKEFVQLFLEKNSLYIIDFDK